MAPKKAKKTVAKKTVKPVVSKPVATKPVTAKPVVAKKAAVKKVAVKKPVVKAEPIVKETVVSTSTCCVNGCGCKGGFVKKLFIFFVIFALGFAACKYMSGPCPCGKGHGMNRPDIFTDGCLDVSKIQDAGFAEHVAKIAETADADTDGCITPDEFRNADRSDVEKPNAPQGPKAGMGPGNGPKDGMGPRR